MAKGKGTIRKGNKRQYTFNLQNDADADLIEFLDKHGVTGTVKEALRLLKEKKMQLEMMSQFQEQFGMNPQFQQQMFAMMQQQQNMMNQQQNPFNQNQSQPVPEEREAVSEEEADDLDSELGIV